MTEDYLSRLSRITVEKASDAVLWINQKGAIKHANSEACNRLDYEYKELIEMNISDINPEFTQERTLRAFRILRAEGSYLVKSSHFTKNGREIPVEISGNLVVIDGEEYTCSFVRDITERKRKESALRGALLELRELKIREDRAQELATIKETTSFIPKKNEEIQTLDALQKQYITHILQLCDWRVSGKKGAALLLGMNANTLISRIKKLGIKRSGEVI
ncbi:MAG: PAS domain S-box-containing protein [Saprospiraceae bacterium]|jgi:PAS domain S-box-containing protein